MFGKSLRQTTSTMTTSSFFGMQFVLANWFVATTLAPTVNGIATNYNIACKHCLIMHEYVNPCSATMFYIAYTHNMSILRLCQKKEY